jgi:hypothetical protein
VRVNYILVLHLRALSVGSQIPQVTNGLNPAPGGLVVDLVSQQVIVLRD